MRDELWFGHPRGLSTLFFTEMWERFSYYGMRAILILFLVAPASSGGLGWPTSRAASLYGLYTMLVYASAIPGGWLADRLLGRYNAVLTGGVVIALGHFSMAVPRIETFYLGLGLIIIGTGLLKPNVSSMVGTLYAEKDARRDSGFSLFYMGINVGATASPLVCGWLGQRVSWHAGFAAAGVGMLLGLTQYVLGSRHLARVRTAAMSTAARRTAKAAQAPLTGGDWRRIGLILVLFFFAIVFWSAFEQAGSSLTLFADRYTRLSILGFSFPSSWFQSEQPLFVITLAPLFAWLWIALGRREPSSTTKFALGLLLVSAGFLILTPAAYIAQGQHQRVSPLWLTALYFVHTLGELCLSPVGLSLVTKLSPPRVLGMMMGVWFLGTAFGNFLAGRVAALFDVIPVYQLFGGVCTITLIAGTILLILGRPIQRLAGQKPQAVPPLDSIAA